MKLLITGSGGMLGSSLARVAQNFKGIDLVLWNRGTVDLLDGTAVNDRLKRESPDVLIHAAAKVGGIQANVAHPVEFLVDNIRIDANVLESATASKIDRLVYVGSSCMYPRNFRQPLLESDLLAGPLEPTNEGYAIAKIAGSRLARYISSEFHLSYRTIIPSNLYGPGDNFKASSSHLVAACLRKIHEAKNKKLSSIDVWGNGEARREFTFVDDISNWLIENIENIPLLPNELNLGFGNDYSVNDYYEAAMAVVGYKVRLNHDIAKPTGMTQKLMDSTLAREKFEWNPQTNLHEGMKLAYEDFLAREL